MVTTEDHPWVPEACTLPTVEQPLRLAEFDDLFTTALQRQHRLTDTALRWELDPAAERKARGLTERESGCCLFFTFTIRPGEGVLSVDVEVPTAYTEVLDALWQRAAGSRS
ncbi:hypothetical protein KZ829_41610 [Actinoplanes hulinensis]|uniref:Uncharacterized protein n=1 Tax=Actinoplanes hulinensis TaxID=1144547 RepID=A0ABS7BHB8_9ACTN|nr:hypothetical protein [Actinoplanes hulinensis]MBW6440240.1 hypothetical protein [Actinoplanes hulinensis]